MRLLLVLEVVDRDVLLLLDQVLDSNEFLPICCINDVKLILERMRRFWGMRDTSDECLERRALFRKCVPNEILVSSTVRVLIAQAQLNWLRSELLPPQKYWT